MKKQETEIKTLKNTVKELHCLNPLANVVKNRNKYRKLTEFLDRDDEEYNS